MAKWSLNESQSGKVRVYAAFEENIRQRFLIWPPMPETLAAGAVNLIPRHPDVPLRPLDAMHLVISAEINATVVATSDRVMADGSSRMGLQVVRFI